MFDLIVVGAGPSGCRLAARAAEAGWRTLLLEEHGQVGSPVHCTGIVGEEMLARYRLPARLVAGEVAPFTVVSPGGRAFPLPRVRAWLLHRAGLDAWLAEQAVAAGAVLETGTTVTAVAHQGQSVALSARTYGRTRELRARVAVLATGAMTNLPYRSGLEPPTRFYRTAQLSARVAGLQGAELFLGHRLAPGSFAYAVSSGGEAGKLGVIARSVPWHGLRRLVRDLEEAGRLGARADRPVCRRIPMGLSPRSARGRILAVGDAAGQAKTTTGGGIYYGMACADLLADTLLEARAGGDFRPEVLAGYDRLWKRRLAGELRAGSRVRRIFERVADADLEELVGLLARPDVLSVIAERGHFDLHRPLLHGLTALPSVRRAALGLARRRLAAAGLFQRLYAALGRCLPLAGELAG